MAAPDADVIVVGGGISGLAFAWVAADTGRSVLVLERAARAGGCIETHRTPDGFWFELGAHTAYNSYGGLLEMIEGAGLRDRILARKKAPFRLLRDGRLLSVGGALDKWEALRSAPVGLFAGRNGRTVREYFSRLAGPGNYERVVGPFLAAVPSQNPDSFPASGPGSLFKKRPRRKDVMRAFTLAGGLGSIVEAAAQRPSVTVRTNVEVRAVAPEADGFVVLTATGRLSAAIVALAVPPPAAAAIARGAFAELAADLGRIQTAKVETVGVAVEQGKVALAPTAFVVPTTDLFWSVVTRDVVPDERLRGFSFHFKPGADRERKMRRITEVLGVARGDLRTVAEKETVLPSPVLGHEAVVAAIDAKVAGKRLAVTGNFFAGLAIEDCVVRSKTEWARVAALGGS